MSERLPYIDNVLSTYLWAKEHLSKTTLYFQIFAIGHEKDIRNVLRPTGGEASSIKSSEESPEQKEESQEPKVLSKEASDPILKIKDKEYKVEEVEEIPFSQILPSGCKIIYLSNASIQKYLMNQKESLIRSFVSGCDFPMFEDDMVEFKIYNDSTIYATGFGLMNEVKVHIKNLRENFKIKKNSLIELDLRIVKFGEIRKYIEQLSYCQDESSTFKYLDYLTSREKIKNELFDLLNNERLDKLDDRVKIFGLSKPEHQSWNAQYLTLLCESLPENFYFPDETGVDMLEDILDVEGIIENTGANFSNNHLINEMNYREGNIRCKMLKEYIESRTKLL